MRTGVWAVSMVRNEEDIVAYCLNHLLQQDLDGIIVMDHCSDDNTREVLMDVQSRNRTLMVLANDDPAYLQSSRLNEMIQRAKFLGGRWIATFDADELWYAKDRSVSLGEAISKETAQAVYVPVWDHRQTSKDPESENPFLRMPWKEKERDYPGHVIVKIGPGIFIDQGHHNIYLHGRRVIPVEGTIEVRHVGIRNANHFVKKTLRARASLKSIPNYSKDKSVHWWFYVDILDKWGEAGLKDWYSREMFVTNPEESLVYDPIPYKDNK